MSIRKVAGEPEQFTGSYDGWTASYSSLFDSNYARGNVQVNRTTEAVLTLPSAIVGASENAWVHFSWAFYRTSSWQSYADIWFCRLHDGNGDLVAEIGATNGVPEITVYGTDDSTQTATGSTACVMDQRYTFDLHVAQSGSDVVAVLYQDGVAIATATLAGKSARDTQAVHFRGGINYSTIESYLSEVIVADEDTRSMRLYTLAPTADGAQTDWSGGYADVDETTPDGTEISTTTADATSTFTHAGGVAGSVRAVAVSAYFRAADDGSDVDAVLRIAGTDYSAALDADPGLSLTHGQAIWNTSPATGSPITDSEINGAEFGVVAVAGP